MKPISYTHCTIITGGDASESSAFAPKFLGIQSIYIRKNLFGSAVATDAYVYSVANNGRIAIDTSSSCETVYELQDPAKGIYGPTLVNQTTFLQVNTIISGTIGTSCMGYLGYFGVPLF